MSSIVITGGTGTFGNAFVRKCLREQLYSRIVIFSRGEYAQAQMRAALESEFGDKARITLRFFIGDVRDEARLMQAICDGDDIIHAAALKRVEVCEYNPIEAVMTNVFGTVNVVRAAIACGARRIMFISSDKACAPYNFYGKTKAVAESLICQANVYAACMRIPARFSCVRYGNVLASRGSVVELWRTQGKQITLTDPFATRFFISIDGAVNFVLQSLDAMQGGEIFVPKIRSFLLADLALAVSPGSEFNIVGLLPGEKAHEELIATTEATRAREFPTQYIILPIAPEWRNYEWGGEGIAADFSYNSRDNPLRVSDVGKIKEWVNEQTNDHR